MSKFLLTVLIIILALVSAMGYVVFQHYMIDLIGIYWYSAIVLVFLFIVIYKFLLGGKNDN